MNAKKPEQDIPQLITDYYELPPDPTQEEQRVSFGTSGHRGTSLKRTFNQDHILAITQAICDYRKDKVSGAVFIGKDTHALSNPAMCSAIEILTANDVKVKIAKDGGFTPTPAVSNAIINHNRHSKFKADGIVITPSHNPPSDGGFKYNTTSGGPADTTITKQIEKEANRILRNNLRGIKRLSFPQAMQKVEEFDFKTAYVDNLKNIIDLDAIRKAGIKIGADALGGAGIGYYEAIRDKYDLNIEPINSFYEPTFSFMPPDYDGKIRMDCSSPHAMANLIKHKDKYDIAFGNDTDFDRHGIVTKDGLLNPNHYLCVAIAHIIKTRGFKGKVGKTIVSSSMIDRVASSLKREIYETPVGFKWFVEPLESGECFFGGEESAGASFLDFNGAPFSTDKDGIIMNLLAAEILAKEGKSPSQIYAQMQKKFGTSYYERIDKPCSADLKAKILDLNPKNVKFAELAGEKIEHVLTKARGNDESFGGLKVISQNAWFAIRPSGTEDLYKIYAESFVSAAHLKSVIAQASDFANNL